MSIDKCSNIQRFGSDEDYTEISDKGEIRFKGRATVFDDITCSLINKRLSGTTGRLDYNYADGTITIQPGGSSSNDNDCLIFNIQKPHGAKKDSVMGLHMHWEQNSTDVIEFTIQYRIQRNNQPKTTAWETVYANSTDDAVFVYTGGVFNQIIRLADIDLTGVELSSTVQFKICRTDATTENIEALFIDAHIEYDALGSEEEFTKYNI